MLLGFILTRVFKLPSWVTPAVSFNNTTALPLLLIQSLSSTGCLDQFLMSDSDTISSLLLRAKSYFLVNAMIGDSLTFALGPRLLHGEEASEEDEHEGDTKLDNGQPDQREAPDAEHGTGQRENGHASSSSNEPEPDEETSLLPNPVVRSEEAAGRLGAREGRKVWMYLPHWLQSFLHFSYAFLNPPLIGAVTGAIIGLAPPLHKVFFEEPAHGGIFKAWLTDSVKNIGELFPALQVVAVGVKLSKSFRKMKRGEESGRVPWVPMLIVLFVRFVMWPA